MVAGGADGSGALPGVEAVARRIDDGAAVPVDTPAHDAAAALLCYFKALPEPFFPESVSTVRFLGVTACCNDAAALLQGAAGTVLPRVGVHGAFSL